MSDMPDGLWFILVKTKEGDEFRCTGPHEREVAERAAERVRGRMHEIKLAHIAFDSVEDFDGR